MQNNDTLIIIIQPTFLEHLFNWGHGAIHVVLHPTFTIALHVGHQCISKKAKAEKVSDSFKVTEIKVATEQLAPPRISGYRGHVGTEFFPASLGKSGGFLSYQIYLFTKQQGGGVSARQSIEVSHSKHGDRQLHLQPSWSTLPSLLRAVLGKLLANVVCAQWRMLRCFRIMPREK